MDFLKNNFSFFIFCLFLTNIMNYSSDESIKKALETFNDVFIPFEVQLRN